MEKFKKMSALLTMALALSCTSCGKEPATPSENSGQDGNTVPPALLNGGFESRLDGWTITGDQTAASITQEASIGKNALRISGSSASASVSVEQSIENITEGVYDLRFYYKKSASGTGTCYVGIEDGNGNLRSFALASAPDTWTEGLVRGVRIDGGECTVKIRCEAQENGWCMIDGLSFRNSDGEYCLLKGGDISELSYIESKGGKYYLDGQQMDCVELLAGNGFNIARLRLYNDPSKPVTDAEGNTVALPAGYQDEADILSLAKRAKDAGMQIELTFHYSDSWTNGGAQNKPDAWKYMDFETLKQTVHDYTTSFLEKMEAQGTLPEYVSLGNETQAGMLYPDGDIVKNPGQLCELYNAGASAVREAAPEAKIIIHSDAAGDYDKYDWEYGILEAGNVDYDIIGASYYPFYENKSVDDIIAWAETVSGRFDKDIMIMECGYAWNPTLPDGYPGQIAHNGPYKEMTKLGQKNFMLELFSKIQMNPDARIAGVLYWDPIFIEAGDAGWALGEDNVVSNTTLFDFDGNALEVFDAFRGNN